MRYGTHWGKGLRRALAVLGEGPDGSQMEAMLHAPQPSTLHRDCLVCGRPAHGIHFGVASCRACAAFFRRTVFLEKVYHCKTKGNCTTSKGDKLSCRKCRYEKCIEEGMTPENVQYNRDRLSSTQSRGGRPLHSDPFYPLHDIKQEEHSPSPEITSRSRSASNATLLESLTNTSARKKIVPDIRKIFESVPRPQCSSLLESLSSFYSSSVSLRGDAVSCDLACHFQSVSMWDGRILALARLATHFPHFHALTASEKMSVFLSRCGPLLWMEMMFSSVRVFPDGFHDGRLCLLLADNLAVDMEDELDFDPFGFLDVTVSPAQFKQMMSPLCERIRCVGRSLLTLAPSQQEMIFIAGHILWNIDEVEGVSMECLDACEAVRDEMGGELHSYYEQAGNNDYAHRLMNLMTIAADIEDLLREREKLLHLARLFDIVQFKTETLSV